MPVDKPRPRRPRLWLHLAVVLGVVAALGADAAGTATVSASWKPFDSFFNSGTFSPVDCFGVGASLAICLLAIGYAILLSRKVASADKGTPGMQAIAQAVRDGSDAYLKRQFRIVGVLMLVLALLIVLTKWPWAANDPHRSEHIAVAISRGIAFLFGSVFSAVVGFFGMRLATTGNLRVAAAARKGFAPAMRLGYQTGTVTGMLTTGLGLLGGCLIVVVMGEKAYETLLGFAFGGSLLALFMRVGGGIYTKAADVGADLVGKVERDIPEDDPRNAATIADNVGDNVGDCAGMAADVFESYTVTMVAAMILGYAAFGPKAMLLPLFIQAVGIACSFISTALVGRKSGGSGSSAAMKSINNSYRVAAVLSAAGMFALAYGYLQFDNTYVVGQSIERGLSTQPEFRAALGLPEQRVGATWLYEGTLVFHDARPAWKALSPAEQSRIASIPAVFERAHQLVPVHVGSDWRPAICCFIGILLTLALMYCTEYWTSTEYSPVQGIVKASRTGDATNIIQGIAVGYESTVWAVILIAAALFGAVYIYNGTGNPLFIAYGVSLAGIGMLALTTDMLSMDVFGPVADNANGIGEMGFNRDPVTHQMLTAGHPDYIPPKEAKAARQILSDLDATGNTTKAITKGIAIGSAVIAAVSLFASFIAVLVVGSEERINELTAELFQSQAGLLSVAKPEVFIGMLIGGAVPFLFSSMTIRAVGRAAYLIVNECRRQFHDKAIWEGTKRPDYGRVVDICTTTAQRELVGPGLLALFTPVLVGFVLGPYALGGFLAGMIVVGQLIAVFMTTAGGSWDNAKKMIEDQPKTDLSGKGSPQHKASVTGDTVGDPLKDTSGPAINPLIKVMNMVSLLVLPLVMAYNVTYHPDEYAVGLTVIVVCLLAVGWAWWQSKRDTAQMRELDAQYEVDLKAALARKQM